MLERLIVVHSKKSGQLEAMGGPWLQWKTCLRHIAIGDNQWEVPSLESDVEYYRGSEAYRFLVEVVSGLHSPMVGETEVFGQFRKFISESNYPKTGWGEAIQKIFEQIRLDVKRIRRDHLIGLGSQSYGSLIRKKTKQAESIHFLGSGLLTQEILPWLAKFQGSIIVHCRDPKKYIEAQREFSFATWVAMNDPTVSISGDLVVCAPMESREIIQWVYSKYGLPQHAFDLRGESRKDPLRIGHRVECLTSLFSEIESAKSQAHQKVKRAYSEIKAFTLNLTVN